MGNHGSEIERILREDMAGLRALLDNTPLIFLLDEQGLVAFVAGQGLADLELAPDAVVGRSAGDIFPENPRIREGVGRALSGEAFSMTAQVAGRWFDIQCYPICEQGAVTGTLVLAVDAAARRTAESALQQERDRAQSYLDIAEVILVALNARGEVTLINRKGRQLLGYEECELLGQNWFSTCLRPQDRETVERVFQQLMAGEAGAAEYFENHVQTKAGKERLIAWHNALLRDPSGKVVGSLSSGEDITERRQIEQDIRQLYLTEQRRRRVAETLRQASLVFGATLELDEVLERILQQLREVIPCDSASIQRLQEDHLRIIAAHGFAEVSAVIGLSFPLDDKFPNRKVIVTKTPLPLKDVGNDYPHFHTEEVVYSSGHIRSWLGVPLLIKDRVIGMITIDRNEVRPYTAEEVELAQAFAGQAAVAIENARLYDDVQQRMKQLQAAQLQLVQSSRLAAIGELAAGVAHELNNPLTSVLGFAELLAERDGLTPEDRRDLETIIAEAYRARDIVRGLLDFARHGRSMRMRIDVNLLLQQTLAVIRHHLEQSGVVIAEAYAPDLPFLFLDEGKMKQVALNLITNAAQAMPDGGTLHIRTARRGDGVAITVADTGSGIPLADQERIFDPFFTTKPNGTGLGLAVSLGIVQEHGGRITVESATGQGSTFTVWLPFTLGEEE